jgi:hypothetical protein
MVRLYEPKVFTRENPCTKIDLHNCFYSSGAYRPRKVIEARMEIGLNAPKYLIREGYVTERHYEGADWYCPTPEGDAYLRNGILRFLVLHPDRARECKELPPGYVRTAAKKAAKTSPTPPAAAPRIVHRRMRPSGP